MNDPRVEMQAQIDAIKADRSLRQPPNFNARLMAIDSLEFSALDEAKSLVSDLESINHRLFNGLRDEILAGRNIRDLIEAFGLLPDAMQMPQDVEGYDNLDIFLNGLFSADSIPFESLDLGPEMVFYQKTPGRIVLEMDDRTNFSDKDVFYDLGSGLGQVPLLVNLLSGVTAKGIEIDPAYIRYSEHSAKTVGIQNVAFIQADVRTENLSDGTVFFLYTPFTGKILEEVLEKLKTISERKRIRVFTYGPCTFEVSKMSWLKPENKEPPHVFTLREFRSV